jgi:hypothetical protein
VGIPKSVAGGMSDLSDLQTAWQKLNPSADQKEIATLQATKDKLQLLSDIHKLQAETTAGTQTN